LSASSSPLEKKKRKKHAARGLRPLSLTKKKEKGERGAWGKTPFCDNGVEGSERGPKKKKWRRPAYVSHYVVDGGKRRKGKKEGKDRVP